MNLKTQTVTEKVPDFTTVYGFLTEEQKKAYSKMTGGIDDGPDGGLEGWVGFFDLYGNKNYT